MNHNIHYLQGYTRSLHFHVNRKGFFRKKHVYETPNANGIANGIANDLFTKRKRKMTMNCTEGMDVRFTNYSTTDTNDTNADTDNIAENIMKYQLFLQLQSSPIEEETTLWKLNLIQQYSHIIFPYHTDRTSQWLPNPEGGGLWKDWDFDIDT